MTQEGFKRKLTAILSADAVGYSRLMAEDETATVKTIASYREIMASLVKQHRGRVVDSPGDNLLAEFSSVVDAVQCAVAVQSEFQTRNAELAENRRMEFRIGINLGDVIAYPWITCHCARRLSALCRWREFAMAIRGWYQP